MAQASQSLLHRQLPLAAANEQLRVLNGLQIESFADRVAEGDEAQLTARSIDILQVNVGKMCNMTCRHCHVDAGPDRREIMPRETVDQCLTALADSNIRTLDLTGGAPEMNPHFRYFVAEARKLGVHVIDRCNLTILLAKGYEDMVDFLAEQGVEVVASLPCYLAENTDKQRGDGAYAASIEAMQRLNQVGYGKSEELLLSLVYNPVGLGLPPAQAALEKQYRDHLREHYQIEFSRLFAITNMPISRFLEELLDKGKLEEYMQSLLDAYNPAAVQEVMCRTTLSVSWDGRLFDCDFNQMLDISTAPGTPKSIADFNSDTLTGRTIVTGPHCYGCTAGAGSSCQGSIL